MYIPDQKLVISNIFLYFIMLIKLYLFDQKKSVFLKIFKI